MHNHLSNLTNKILYSIIVGHFFLKLAPYFSTDLASRRLSVYIITVDHDLETFMATTTSGFNKISFTTSVGIDNEFGLATWTNIQNASGAPNGTFAQSQHTQVSAERSHWLMGSNFGFNIPTNSQLDSVALLVTHRGSGAAVNSIYHANISLGSGSVPILNQIVETDVSGAFVTKRIPFTGNVGQFTPSVVNSTGFLVGTAYRCGAIGNNWVLVDSIGVELTYSIPETGPVFYKTASIARLGPMTYKI